MRTLIARWLRVLANRIDPPPQCAVCGMRFDTRIDSDGRQWTFTDEGEAIEGYPI